jgi:hypothetical protein
MCNKYKDINHLINFGVNNLTMPNSEAKCTAAGPCLHPQRANKRALALPKQANKPQRPAETKTDDNPEGQSQTTSARDSKLWRLAGCAP